VIAIILEDSGYEKTVDSSIACGEIPVLAGLGLFLDITITGCPHLPDGSLFGRAMNSIYRLFPLS
jgi:hypothetical protein